MFVGDFGLRDTFQERIAPTSTEIDIEKLRMKFSALNVDWSKCQFSRFKETCARKHQRAVGTVVSQSFVKMVADHHRHAAYHNKH